MIYWNAAGTRSVYVGREDEAVGLLFFDDLFV